ncbi:anti-sigma factor [Cellulomonas endophytica]|uniref:anti-sigma factor n=1 Tax=Cellulomonas endophytica TaxID=2494735 RepID=UPI001010BE1C|nr:anti-sigma factor [Cellulomonas endophytica]
MSVGDGARAGGTGTGGTEEDVRELLGAYALDAVDADERRAVERLVARDPEAAAELAELRWVATRLGEAVAADPPAGLRDAVLAAVRGVPQLPSSAVGRAGDEGGVSGPSADTDGLRTSPLGDAPAPVAPAPPAHDGTPGRRALRVAPDAAPEVVGDPSGGAAAGGPADERADGADEGADGADAGRDWSGRRAARAVPARPGRLRVLAVAAAFVVGVAVPGTLAVQQAQRASDAEAAQAATARSIADLLADPDARVVRGELAAGGTATAVYTADAALFSAAGVPAPDEGRAYQLWVVDGDEIRSAGVLERDGDALVQVVDDYGSGALAVTLEPSGGSTQPTTDPLVVLTEA